MSQNTASPQKSSTSGAWAAGGTLFAGCLMMITGIIDVLQGIAGIAEDDVYARVGDYVFKFNLTAWGWIHLCIGVVVIITAFGILMAKEWGRIAGIALAGLNIVAQFLFLPYQPWWALFSMAVSIFIVWALATNENYGREFL
ncbi:hypothetical protein ACIGEZ_07035 [Streptomyces sp. NPDC085481]|uniref:DUF7144 family membrane protein n=1 Tax=Streptomyces sp. NPDC085481 TaxID=3365727 RepID=UPI0037D920EA